MLLCQLNHLSILCTLCTLNEVQEVSLLTTLINYFERFKQHVPISLYKSVIYKTVIYHTKLEKSEGNRLGPGIKTCTGQTIETIIKNLFEHQILCLLVFT